jgi:CheY-like chemotaxis protein
MTKRIFVVEDQEDLRGVLRDLLTGSGYDVAEVADGRDGVAKAQSQRPDLILMDIQLPIVDGYVARSIAILSWRLRSSRRAASSSSRCHNGPLTPIP